MKWEIGRQGTGYFKKLLGSGPFWDCWLLKYPAGSSIPVHTDPVSGKVHRRINIVIWGEQTFMGENLFRFGSIVYFRPDIMPHSVMASAKVRYVFSLGWALDT